jgi:hypothetical protein
LGLLERLGNPAGSLPFTIVLDRSGTVAYRKLGVLREQEVEAFLPPLLQ